MRSIRFRVIGVTLLAVGVPLLIFTYLLNERLWSFYISQLETQLESQANMVSEISVPILQRRKPQEGLAEVVDRWDRLMGIRLIVADDSGTILAGTVGFASLKVGTKVDDIVAPGMLDALRGTRNSTTWRGPDQDFEETMYMNLPVREDQKILGAVRVSYSLGQVKSGVATIRRTLLVGFTIYGFLLLLTILLLAGSLARPVEALNRSALRLSAGELEHKIEPNGPIELQQLAHTLNRMTDRLTLLETHRRRYVSDVSHELRAPLAAIRTMTETLMTHGEEDPALFQRYLPRIVSQTDRLARLASQLLDLAQIESGALTHHTAEVDLLEIIEEVVQTTEQGAKERDVQIRTRVPDELPTLFAHRDRLVQMLLNLVDNGIHYTPAGGYVEVAAETRKDQVLLSVKDNGPGIPPESLPHLFERFYRVDKARTPNRGGAGLGLSIVHQIVESHDGKIKVESRVDHGTTFHITLPLPE